MKSKLPFLALLLPSIAFAGANYFKVAGGESDQAKVEAVDIVADEDVVKFKANITNKTDQYLLFDTNKPVFRVGDQTVTTESDAWKALLVINPHATDDKVLDAVGSNMKVDAFSVTLNGFSTADPEGTPVDIAPFRLPSEGDTFDTGGFECALGKLKKETKETVAPFKCTYTGDKMALVRPDRIMLRVEGLDQRWNNDAKPKTLVVFPGMSFKFKTVFNVPARDADMQFATMWLDWEGTFAESEMVPVGPVELAFELDAGLTESKQ